MTIISPLTKGTACAFVLTALVALASSANAQSTGKSSVRSATLFERIDADHDGKATFEEYTAYRDHVIWGSYDPHDTGKVSRRSYVRGNHVRAVEFTRLDTNHDRFIEKAEFDVETKRLFDRRDRNKDGILTSDEFRTRPKTSTKATP